MFGDEWCPSENLTLSDVNEGDEAIPNVTKDSEGDISSPGVRFSEGHHSSPNTQVSEGDSNDNDLVMPTMVNLESSGLRRSSVLLQDQRNITTSFQASQSYVSLEYCYCQQSLKRK